MFNTFDAVVLILVCAGAFQGYRIGFISGAVFAAAGAAGVWLIRKILPGSGMSLPLLFLLMLAALLAFYRWYRAKKEMGKTYRYFINRVGGGLAGILLVLVMVGTVLLPFMHQLPGQNKETVFNSFSAMNVIPAVQQFFPGTQASIIGRVHGVIVTLQRGAVQEHRPKSKKKKKAATTQA